MGAHQPEYEFVRILRENPEGCQAILWKVLQVPSHDHLSAGPDRRGEHVPVIRVGKGQSPDEPLVVRDEAIPDRGAHQSSGASERDAGYLGALSLDSTEALIQDGLRPTGTDQSGLPDPNEEISERRRIEDTGVIDNNDTHAQ